MTPQDRAHARVVCAPIQGRRPRTPASGWRVQIPAYAGMTWVVCGKDGKWISGVEATYPNEVEGMETLGWMSA